MHVFQLKYLLLCSTISLLPNAAAHKRTHAVDTDSWDFDFSFTGIETYAHLPHVKCLTNPDEAFDIAIVGAPL